MSGESAEIEQYGPHCEFFCEAVETFGVNLSI